MQDLQLLNDKLEQLLKNYAALQTENSKLQQTVVQQNQSIASLNKKLGSLEEEMLASKTSAVIANDRDNKAVKKQIDILIGDIDKMMATLND